MKGLEDKTYAIMRIAVGFAFFWHGSQKILGIPPLEYELDTMLTIAGVIELVAGALVTVGFFTSWAAFLASGLMAAAYWMAHGTKALLPLQNQGELAFLFCFVFLFISSRGAGIWSIDAARS